MKNVYSEFEALLAHPDFVAAHWPHEHFGAVSARNMLRATLDEVRLHYADAFAQAVLALQDVEDACHFRHNVMRRELSGEVDFIKQRDHAAHTANLYLLGWYLYAHSGVLHHAFGEHAARRGKGTGPNSVHIFFRNVWMWASLLHDVGYLFEGGLAHLSSEVQAAHVHRGAQHCMDYFEHRLWAEVGLGVDERQSLLDASKVPIPKLDGSSLAAVADGLRQLPALEPLRIQLRMDDRVSPMPLVVSTDLPSPSDSVDPAGVELERPPLRGDAFGLWAQHFHAHEQPAMALRMSALAKVYERQVWDGLPGIGLRIVDHGIGGGLLMLQYSTFYFAIRAALDGRPNIDPETAASWERFRVRGSLAYRPSTWWQAVLWGTAATALHNVQQKLKDWSGTHPALTPLALDEDPIAYLGVLADILQEWDRYPVARGRYLLNGSATIPELPLEGRFVKLGRDSTGRPRLLLPRAFKDKVRQELDSALVGVDRIIHIGTTRASGA